MRGKIKVGISRCLLGENVRYDGGHKLDNYIKDKLGKVVDCWVGVCPEVECGLGIPREAMHLTGAPGSLRLVTRDSNRDFTEKMLGWARKRLEELEKEELCGFIFKSDSPSCGLNSVFSKKCTGIFAKEFVNRFKFMPVEDDGSLRDDEIMEKFIGKIRAFSKACRTGKTHKK